MIRLSFVRPRAVRILEKKMERGAGKRPNVGEAGVVDHEAKKRCSLGSKLFLNKELADVEFDLGTRTVPAHRCILASSSDVFR